MEYKVKYLSYEIRNTATKISSPSTLYEIVKDDFTPVNEDMYLLVLDIKNHIIDKHLIARGGYNSLLIKQRDIFHRVLKTVGTSFAIVHNHPSDDLSPSKEDINFTQRINNSAELLGLTFIDHLIIGPEGFYSFKKNGII